MIGRVHFAGVAAGLAVVLTKSVDRYPHFVVEPGATGVITEATEEDVHVRLDEPVAGAEHWGNELHWSLANGGEGEFVSFLQSVARADEQPWGPTLETLQGAEFRYELARRFAIALRSDLDREQMSEVVEANKAREAGVCHSHDHTDSNMLMLRSLEGLCGIELRAIDEHLSPAWSAAWDLAQAAHFRAPALVPGAKYRGEWGDDFACPGAAEHGGDFFGEHNGYDADDMAAISELDVGQVWQSNSHPCHKILRLA